MPNTTTHLYAVMVHPHRPSELTYEPLLTRASLGATGMAFLAGFPSFLPARERAAEFDAMPAVERWWAASWASRARAA